MPLSTLEYLRHILDETANTQRWILPLAIVKDPLVRDPLHRDRSARNRPQPGRDY